MESEGVVDARGLRGVSRPQPRLHLPLLRVEPRRELLRGVATLLAKALDGVEQTLEVLGAAHVGGVGEEGTRRREQTAPTGCVLSAVLHGFRAGAAGQRENRWRRNIGASSFGVTPYLYGVVIFSFWFKLHFLCWRSLLLHSAMDIEYSAAPSHVPETSIQTEDRMD